MPSSSVSDRPQVLVVDDERLLHNVMSRFLGRHGIDVTSCTSGPEALDVLAEQPIDLVLSDFQMPEMDGLELLAQIRERYPALPVIIITGYANVQHAVRAMSSGAVDYLPKPFSTDVLLERVRRHLAAPPAPPATNGKASKAGGRGGAGRSRAGRGGAASAPAFVGEHPTVVELKAFLPRLAGSQAPVFVHGESGTGKEVVARLVHEQSPRAGGPFVALNCANLPSELVESHLFGHKKGAFTGAVDDMTGAFGRADGGTLLLDEVTEVALPVQAKLLRVLQEGEFQRVGAEKTTRVDVRVVATSNRDLGQAVAEGLFREDLYHRLAVFPLHVPPLRERRSDVPLLADHFATQYATQYGLPEKTLAPALLREFEAYHWPGNVRELGNMLHRGVVLAAERTTIEREDVLNPFFSDGPSLSAPGWLDGEDAPQTLADMERVMILRALGEHDQNQERAAEQLGISARTIRNKLKRYREEGLLPESSLG
ncbi:sigma-54-dependent transcriptional regulator [Rubrivirga litoralis]|uniref:Sigma-54 dependent transcriptional regulator n=1 Tax=Rubrivirga litoralis TaxID=3075598 RepID=A0ABU3BSS9_9BACT|nr:sigma-54 dependent transcriptional regulator [Rubrivirga sp. F394]MDT0632354.1 sigma-54 dependent transcriptional regulator [Rubrivirga sp. F394]